MQMKNSADLIPFMDALKNWAIANSDSDIYEEIVAAGNRGDTASSLIIEYGKSLERLKPHVMGLPASFQEHWDKALIIIKETISPGEY
jgi:hypothetical protein